MQVEEYSLSRVLFRCLSSQVLCLSLFFFLFFFFCFSLWFLLPVKFACEWDFFLFFFFFSFIVSLSFFFVVEKRKSKKKKKAFFFFSFWRVVWCFVGSSLYIYIYSHFFFFGFLGVKLSFEVVLRVCVISHQWGCAYVRRGGSKNT